jgi:hypothetical protein
MAATFHFVHLTITRVSNTSNALHVFHRFSGPSSPVATIGLRRTTRTVFGHLKMMETPSGKYASVIRYLVQCMKMSI